MRSPLCPGGVNRKLFYTIVRLFNLYNSVHDIVLKNGYPCCCFAVTGLGHLYLGILADTPTRPKGGTQAKGAIETRWKNPND